MHYVPFVINLKLYLYIIYAFYVFLKKYFKLCLNNKYVCNLESATTSGDLPGSYKGKVAVLPKTFLVATSPNALVPTLPLFLLALLVRIIL